MLEHEVEDSFVLQAGGQDQTSLFDAWEDLHPSFLTHALFRLLRR